MCKGPEAGRDCVNASRRRLVSLEYDGGQGAEAAEDDGRDQGLGLGKDCDF